MAVTTGYIIINIMWGFLRENGRREKDKEDTPHYCNQNTPNHLNPFSVLNNPSQVKLL
jgi:hypothetical protein